MSTIPICREEITPEWLSSVLSSAGDCQIIRLDLEDMSGYNLQLSQLFRVRITYSVRNVDHPDVVIVKMPAVDDRIRIREAASGPYVGELGSYRLLEPFYNGSIARLYGAVEDHGEKTVCFVLEDIGEFTEDQKYANIDLGVARSTLGFMATFHGRFWEDANLGESDWCRDADWSFLFNQDPLDSAIGWQVICDDDRFTKSGGLIVAGEYLGKRLNKLRDVMSRRPKTLTHNDFHQGNIMLRQTPAGLLPVIIDWQMPAFAGATNDLAKFMMTAVPFSILAEQEGSLVEYYYDNLKANGVKNYSLDECWRDYRRAQVATFGNYSINCFETAPDGGLVESSGDSTHAVIKALTLVDPIELNEYLP
ncbi:MAG: phosphotransferase [Chloroflexi bacterium]|nr:phosphotransferase [Chloroflexota bacterium]